MSAGQDPGLFAQLLDWAWAGVLALGGIVFKGLKDDNNKRREDIRQLYQNAEADRKLTRDGFDKLRKELNDQNVAILNAIHGIRK